MPRKGSTYKKRLPAEMVLARTMKSARLLREGNASLRAWKMAEAVWTHTAGYRKAVDYLYLEALMEATGMDKRGAQRAIHQCHRLGAFVWEGAEKKGQMLPVALPRVADGDPEWVVAMGGAADLPSAAMGGGRGDLPTNTPGELEPGSGSAGVSRPVRVCSGWVRLASHPPPKLARKRRRGRYPSEQRPALAGEICPKGHPLGVGDFSCWNARRPHMPEGIDPACPDGVETGPDAA